MKSSYRSNPLISGTILITLLCWAPAAFSQLEIMMQQPLLSVGDKQFTLLKVELAPLTGNDDRDSGHRHPGDTIVYVESGTVTNQMNNEEVKEYKAGEYWYEAPGDLHAQFRNNDPEESAVVIVFMINETGEALSE